MGNYNSGTIKFKQSQNDFPLTVGLGRKTPSWELSRWKENQGLRFLPYDDEGFSLRGDKKRLLYKGRRRSHRFTILGDGSFEYDCILNREPESNVISLRMEGAENFDFYRQPDFVADPFFKGSYAVYLKDTLVGQGTGKLCHIHRPLIIDALGRKCWGVLSVVGDELRITIPEQWLGKARYPVIVDPIVGTTTIGSQYLFEGEPLFFEVLIPVNRFYVSQKIQGICTAYFYSNDDEYGDAGGKAVIFSDNNDVPLYRKSKQEQWIDFTVNGNKPKSWRSGTFSLNGNIDNDSYIWFGCYVEFFWYTRFDYGLKCYCEDYSDYYWGNNGNMVDVYPINNVNRYSNLKLSMYFDYISSQNFSRTITQGVNLSDKRISDQYCKRFIKQNVKGIDNNIFTISYKRKLIHNIYGTDQFIFSISFFRNISLIVSNLMNITKEIYYTRLINEFINIYFFLKQCKGYIIKIYDFSVVFLKTERKSNLLIKQSDFVKTHSFLIRSFLIFVKLLVATNVRDFILRRFLIAKEEIILKSLVTINVTLDSKI